MSLRPFKVWSADRKVKKSLVASSLNELIDKGCSELGYRKRSRSRPITVVCEDDGTEVNNPKYFDLLPGNSTFILLQKEEQWTKPEEEDLDEVDSSAPATLDPDLAKKVLSVRNDLSCIAIFSDSQLQQLIDCDRTALALHLHKPEWFTESVQETCQRLLDASIRSHEEKGLIDLIQRAGCFGQSRESLQKTELEDKSLKKVGDRGPSRPGKRKLPPSFEQRKSARRHVKVFH